MDTETYVEDKLLDHIRLVCSSAHCTATKLDINGKKHLVHKTICMEPYVFKSRVQQWFMNPDFAELEIMDEKGKCKRCGCSWTMHLATKYETVEKKKSTDKEIEPKPVPKISYDDSGKPEIEWSPNGDATIEVFNFNIPHPSKKKKDLSRSGSKKSSRSEKSNKSDEEKLKADGDLTRDGSKKSSKSEKESIKIEDKLNRDGSKKSNKSEKESIKVEDKLNHDGSKKSSRSEKESIKVEDKLNRDGSKKSSKSEKESIKIEDKLNRDGSKKSNKSEKESIKVEDKLNRDGSKKSSKSEKESIKIEEKLNRDGSKKSSRSEKESIKVEDKLNRDGSKKSSKSEKSNKSDESKKSNKNEEKTKVEIEVVEERVEVPNNLNASITIEENKNDSSKKEQRPKTTEIDLNDLPKKLKEEKRPKTTEVRIDDLHKNYSGKEEEEKPKRRAIRFKTSAVDSNDLPKSEEKQDLKTKYKTTGVDPSQLPAKKAPEVPISPKRRSIKFKLPTKEKTPTNKFDNNFNDQFDEIHEVLHARLEDYTPASKLLRFSDIIDFADKDEKEESKEGGSEQSNVDDASTVYANLDKNSRKLEPSPDRIRSSSPRKFGKVLDRPNFSGNEDKMKSNGQVKEGKSKAEQGKPKKPTRLRFGKHDEPTIASSTVVTHNSNKKANKMKYIDNVKQLHPTISKQTCDDEDFCRELACEQEGELDHLIHVDEDTRSEKCRRWLVDNSLAPAPKRPEKFLQRLKRLVVNKGSQLKDHLVGRRRRVNET